MRKLAAPSEFKALIAAHGGQRQAARACKVSPALINLLANQGMPPKTGWASLQNALQQWLTAQGATADTVTRALREAAPKVRTPRKIINKAQIRANTAGEDPMIFGKQTLVQGARQHFSLKRDPFSDPQTVEEIYLTPESRYVREVMYDAACNGNFLAVIGESGSGKSTLREEMIERLKTSGESVIVIEPYTLSMTETDKYGKPLRAQHIAEAIIDTVQRGARCAGSPEMRGRMLHQMLIASSRGGNRHVLVIEEAHDLHVQTIKSLKRFWELKDGMRRLLSIILIGQTELRGKLSNTQAEVREVVQRCDIIELPPIKDPEAYLAFRFKVAGADISNIFEPEALALLQEQLVVASSLNSNGVYLGYPLAIANLARAAMSKAYEIGESIVTGDVMRLVQPKEAGRV